MFLGEFEHSVDDKGRLAIPAKFRAELSGGLVVTRGLDRCLFVWPMEEWRAIAQKLGQLSLMNADARRTQRRHHVHRRLCLRGEFLQFVERQRRLADRQILTDAFDDRLENGGAHRLAPQLPPCRTGLTHWFTPFPFPPK